MFRSRFADAFPPKSPHFGPQDLERGVAEVLPSPQVESLLCALLALLLNRKKPVESVHPISRWICLGCSHVCALRCWKRARLLTGIGAIGRDTMGVPSRRLYLHIGDSGREHGMA